MYKNKFNSKVETFKPNFQCETESFKIESPEGGWSQNVTERKKKNEICKENGGQYAKEDGFPLPNETIECEPVCEVCKPQDKRVKHNDCAKCNKYRKSVPIGLVIKDNNHFLKCIEYSKKNNWWSQEGVRISKWNVSNVSDNE